jgi:hypothetical protein
MHAGTFVHTSTEQVGGEEMVGGILVNVGGSRARGEVDELMDLGDRSGGQEVWNTKTGEARGEGARVVGQPTRS